MPTSVQVPNLGLVEEFIVVEWLKESGDTVAEGEILALIETEKATVELAAPVAGVLTVLVPASEDLVAADSCLAEIEGTDRL